MSVPLNAVMAAGKIILGIFSSSFFLSVNGFYNIGIGLAKFFALKAHKETAECSDPALTQKKQNRIYFFIGFIVLAASVMYIIYCASRLFGGGGSAKYPRHIALIIAIVSILEIVFSLRGVIISRRDRKPVMEAIKLTNLASSFILLVLTQTAILSFAADADVSLYNGITGILLGSLAALIGLYMIIRMAWLTKAVNRKEKDCPGIYVPAPQIREDFAAAEICSKPAGL